MERQVCVVIGTEQCLLYFYVNFIVTIISGFEKNKLLVVNVYHLI